MAEAYWKPVGRQIGEFGEMITTYEHELPNGILLLIVTTMGGAYHTITYLPYEQKIGHGDTRF